jgi:nitrogen regulatory protein PII
MKLEAIIQPSRFESVKDALREVGKLLAYLNSIPEADGQTTGKDIPKDQLTPAMKEHLKTMPHDKWVQLVTMKNLRIDATIYDATGKQAGKIPTYLFSRPVDEAGNPDPLWQALAKWEGVMTLPRPLLPDAAGKKTPFPKYLTPGIDGLVHVSQVALHRVNHAKDVLKTGQAVEAVVLGVEPDKKRISLSIREVLASDLPPARTPEVGEVTEGRVGSILGHFPDLHGFVKVGADLRFSFA